MVLTIELLDSKRHNRSIFACGNDSLDIYIVKSASQDLKKKVATVFVLIDSPSMDIIAYYTLSTYTVDITNLDKTFTNVLKFKCMLIKSLPEQHPSQKPLGMIQG